MPIQVNIQTSGVNTLEQAVKAFDKMGAAMAKTGTSADKLTAQQKALLTYLKHLSTVGENAGAGLKTMVENFQAAGKGIAAFKATAETGVDKLSVPFSHLSTSVKKVSADVRELGMQLHAISAENVAKLGDAGYMNMVVEGKAAIQMIHQVDVELEKQAALKAEIFALDNNRAPTAWRAEIAALKQAQAETRKLAAEREMLKRNGPALMAGQTSLSGIIPAGIAPQFAGLEKSLRAAYGSATNLSTAVRGTSVEIQKMLAAELEAEGATRALYAANARLAKSYNEISVSTKSAGGSVLAALGNQTAAIEKQAAAAEAAARKMSANFMKISAGYSNANANAGAGATSSTTLLGALGDRSKLKADVDKVGDSVAGLNNKLSQGNKIAIDWGKNMKYAMGGVARSMGAMTYSYAALAPLLAGIAAGSAVKKVYELGAAFEYTTTYVDALKTSLDGLALDGLQDQLLNFEGLRKGPQELSIGMKEFAKAGVDAADSIGQIAEMSKFASIAELDMAAATKLVIGQSQAFDQSFSQSANMISAAALSSATDIEEMATALSYTTELATVSKVSFDEVATAMAVMANAGIRGSKAGTAIRTSILKMQAPTEGFKKQLDALGLSWSAFTSEGQVKSMRTMFMELKRVTDGLPDQERVAILKELFGLRSLKGGANILRSMGGEWDGLNEKIKSSMDGVSFISQTYDKLDETVTAKLEKIGAVFQQQLIKSFDSEAVKGILDDVFSVVASEQFLKNIEAVIKAVNELGKGVSSLLTIVQNLPVDILELGLLGLLIFGKSPVSKAVAGILLIEKSLDAIQKNYSNPIISSALGIEKLDDDVTRSTSVFEKLSLAMKQSQLAWDGLVGNISRSDLLKEMGIQEITASKSKVKLQIPAPTLEGTDLLKQQVKDAVSNGINDGAVLGLKEAAEASSGVDLLNSEGIALKLADQAQASLRPTISAFVDILKPLQEQGELASLDGWAKSMKQAEIQAKSLMEAFKKDHPGFEFEDENRDLKELTRNLLEIEKAKGLAALKRQTEELDFSTMVDGLKKSKNASEQVRGSFLEIKKKAFDAAEAVGQAGKRFGEMRFSPEGAKSFIALVRNARLFEDAIEKAQDKVRGLKNSLQDMKFGFADDLAQVRAKLLPDEKRSAYIYKTQLSQIQQLESAARRASKEGEEGKKREVELLQKAYDIAKSLDTSAPGGGDYINKVKQQYGIMSDLQGKITQAKKDELKTAEEELSGIQKQKQEFEAFAKAVNEGYKGAGKEAEGFGAIMDMNTGQMKTFGDTASVELSRVIDKQAALNELMRTFGDSKFSDYMYSKGTGPASNLGDFTKNAEEIRKQNEAVGNAVEQGLTPAVAKYKELGTVAGEAKASIQAMQEQNKAGISSDTIEQVKSQSEAVSAASKAIKTSQSEAFQVAGQLKERIAEVTEQLKEYRSKAEEIGSKTPGDFDSVTKAIENQQIELQTLIKLYSELISKMREAASTKMPSSPSSNTSGRALGGNTAAGQTYWVGERGPELFTSNTAGFIVPNHIATTKSENVVNLNLSIGGSEAVQLQGSQVEIGKLQRLLSDKARFAA